MDLKITHINKTVENIMQKGATKNNKKNAFRMLKNPLQADIIKIEQNYGKMAKKPKKGP